MKGIYTLLMIAFAAIVVCAQSGRTVSGVVQHPNGSPAEGVKIELRAKSGKLETRTVETTVNGEFRFEGIPDGTHRLTATHAGIELASKELVINATEIDQLVLVLAYRSGISESVTIAADAPEDLDEVSKTVDVVPAQEMRDRADFTLTDTLRTIPGLRVQQLGGFGRAASIKSRGLRNQDTALLIDGIRFRDPGAITGDASPFLSDVTLTSVRRIEVLRGSGSSLYGTNAIGGTVDFQTPQPAPGVHGQISGAAGGLGLARFRGNISFARAGKGGMALGFSRTVYKKGIDGQDNAGNTNLQPRLDFNPTNRTSLSGRFFISASTVRLNTGPETLGALPPAGTIMEAQEGVNFVSDVNDPDSIQRGRFYSGQFAVSHIVNSDLVLYSHYQGLTTRRRNDDGPLGVGFQSAFTSIFGGTIHTANVHGKWMPSDEHSLTAGYEFETERFRNEGSTPAGTDDFWTRAGQRSNTLYAQHVVGLFDDRLRFAAGVRGQWFSLDQPLFSESNSPYENFTLADPPAAYTFDGSASYFITQSGTKLRVHAGNGYRVPSLYERFGTFFFFATFFPQGNPELKPERSLGIDAGIDQYLFGQRARVSATWFYTRIKDEITYLPTDDFGAPAYYNFDRHYSRGAEISVDVKPTRSTDVFASYTFTNSDIRNFRRPAGVAVASTDRKSFGIPDHQFTLVLTQRIKRFWATLDLLATSKYLAPVFSSTTFSSHTYRFAGNSRADLTAGYSFPIGGDKYSLRLFGTIENLLDHKYFENGFRTPRRNGRAGLNFGF